MVDDNLTFFEKRLMAEIDDLGQRIRALETEREVLSKQLRKARAARTGMQYANRKNSVNRVLAENSVIELLQKEGRALSTSKLYRFARMANDDLKENTFRTYLHRMKNKGLICGAGHVGMWKLTQNQ